MQTFKVRLTDSAKKEFTELDGSVRSQVAKQLKSLETNPFKGEMLGNKANMNLSGYYKLYVCNKKIRIVYTVENDMLIVLVVGIGKRDDMEVYRKVFDRITGKE